MSEDLHRWLPNALPLAIAAGIMRTTPESLLSMTRSGVIMPLAGESLLRYSRQDIERVLGRQITAEEYLRADRGHDARREANRRYNAKRSTRRAGARR